MGILLGIMKHLYNKCHQTNYLCTVLASTWGAKTNPIFILKLIEFSMHVKPSHSLNELLYFILKRVNKELPDQKNGFKIFYYNWLRSYV